MRRAGSSSSSRCPRELASFVTRVTIAGTGAQITRIDVAEASGDRSVMNVFPAVRKP